jgi:hypothetical protein
MHIHFLFPQIIRLEKVCFIKGHFILNDVVSIWEGMEWARRLSLKSPSINPYFEKAYDSVELPFNIAILSFGFW